MVTGYDPARAPTLRSGSCQSLHRPSAAAFGPPLDRKAHRADRASRTRPLRSTSRTGGTPARVVTSCDAGSWPASVASYAQSCAGLYPSFSFPLKQAPFNKEVFVRERGPHPQRENWLMRQPPTHHPMPGGQGSGQRNPLRYQIAALGGKCGSGKRPVLQPLLHAGERVRDAVLSRNDR